MEPINETLARQLLERYFQGETSLIEEEQLSTFFCNAQLPNDLLPYRTLFRFFQDEAAMMPLDSAIQHTIRPRRNLLRLWAPLIAAAGILLFFALYYPSKQDYVYIKDGQRIHNQEEAVQLAQQQLTQISIRMQRANAMVDKLEQVSNYTETIHKYILK